MHYLIVVLIWIALIIRDVKHLFMYLLAIFLLRKSLLMTSAHCFSIGLFVFFFLLTCMSFSYILDIYPLSDT